MHTPPSIGLFLSKDALLPLVSRMAFGTFLLRFFLLIEAGFPAARYQLRSLLPLQVLCVTLSEHGRSYTKLESDLPVGFQIRTATQTDVGWRTRDACRRSFPTA